MFLVDVLQNVTKAEGCWVEVCWGQPGPQHRLTGSLWRLSLVSSGEFQHLIMAKLSRSLAHSQHGGLVHSSQCLRRLRAAEQGVCVICFTVCLPGMLSPSDSSAGEACGHPWPEQHPRPRCPWGMRVPLLTGSVSKAGSECGVRIRSAANTLTCTQEGPDASAPTLTACSLSCAHTDLFLTAAKLLAKVFLRQALRCKAAWERPSSPPTARQPSGTRGRTSSCKAVLQGQQWDGAAARNLCSPAPEFGVSAVAGHPAMEQSRVPEHPLPFHPSLIRAPNWSPLWKLKPDTKRAGSV